MTRSIYVAMGMLFLNIVFSCQARSAICTKESWQLVAELYAQAVCYPDQFPDFVVKSKAKYPPGGSWQKCGEQLGNALLSTAQSIADRREMQERAYNVAARAGVPELGGQVADSMVQTANSPAMLGLYLLTIIQSAAQIQAGNVDYYTSTDFYQVTSQAWRLAAFAMGSQKMEMLRKLIYEATVALIADIGERVIQLDKGRGVE